MFLAIRVDKGVVMNGRRGINGPTAAALLGSVAVVGSLLYSILKPIEPSAMPDTRGERLEKMFNKFESINKDVIILQQKIENMREDMSNLRQDVKELIRGKR